MPGKSHGQRSLVLYSPRGHKELDTTEQLLFFTFFNELRPGAHSSRTLSGGEFLGSTAQPSKLGCLYPKILVPCCLTLKLIWTSYIVLCSIWQQDMRRGEWGLGAALLPGFFCLQVVDVGIRIKGVLQFSLASPPSSTSLCLDIHRRPSL